MELYQIPDWQGWRGCQKVHDIVTSQLAPRQLDLTLLVPSCIKKPSHVISPPTASFLVGMGQSRNLMQLKETLSGCWQHEALTLGLSATAFALHVVDAASEVLLCAFMFIQNTFGSFS